MRPILITIFPSNNYIRMKLALPNRNESHIYFCSAKGILHCSSLHTLTKQLRFVVEYYIRR